MSSITGKRKHTETSPGLASGSGSEGAGSSRGDNNASPGEVSHAPRSPLSGLGVRQSECLPSTTLPSSPSRLYTDAPIGFCLSVLLAGG